MSEAVRVPVRRVRDSAAPLPLPAYMSTHAAGLDLLADVDAAVVLRAGERALIPTGIAIALPSGFEGQVRPRSGWALRSGVTVLNAPGTIDADYRGEIQVLLVNLGRDDVTIARGDRIAQLVLSSVERLSWMETAVLDDSERGGGGFGSTGSR
jgi:dUTP pyrophosphatase